MKFSDIPQFTWSVSGDNLRRAEKTAARGGEMKKVEIDVEGVEDSPVKEMDCRKEPEVTPYIWQEIGNQLFSDADTETECKMITRRMKLPFGWRIIVMFVWKEDGRTQIRTETFPVADSTKKWTPEQWAEAQEIFTRPETVTGKDA